MSDGLLGFLAGVLFMTEVNLGVLELVALAYVYLTLTSLSMRRGLRFLSEIAFVSLGPAIVLVDRPHSSGSGLIVSIV